jgi:hypothetical protein
MRAVILRSLAVIGVGGLILAGVLYVASTVDTRPPEVLGVQLTQSLADQPDRALITTSIEVAFSEPVEPDGAEAALSLEPAVAGSVSWSGTTMIFTPADPLEVETEYAVRIAAGVRDLAGNEMAEAPPAFTFVTAGRPMIASADPADGADEVPVDAVVELVFSALMDTASVEAALTVEPEVEHDLRWSGERLEIVFREPLLPATEYRLHVAGSATDVSGVELGRDVSIGFRTVEPALAVAAVIPADGTGGIAPTTPIVIRFDRPVDPASVSSDLLEISPSVGGSLELVSLADSPDGSVLRFLPSAPLSANTTFEVTLLPGVRGEENGGGMAEPVRWTFTTGTTFGTLSNHVLFLSDRAGVTNVWAMNPDGTGQHQVSAELTPVLDYAVAPNGSSLVVSDGWRLVYMSADGSGRQILTEAGFLEFDPTYAPDGSRVAFARADAETGEGLGLWTWEPGAVSADRVDLPADVRPDRPDPTGDVDESGLLLRAPRYAPDGQALAFVAADGRIGLLELPAERFTWVEASAVGAPSWRPDSSGILVSLGESGTEPTVAAPVAPLAPTQGGGVGLVNRSGTRVDRTGFGDEARLAAVGPDGRIAVHDADGVMRVADRPDAAAEPIAGLEGARLAELAFGPAGRVAIIVRQASSPEASRIERVDLETGERAELLRGGWRVRWLP